MNYGTAKSVKAPRSRSRSRKASRDSDAKTAKTGVFVGPNRIASDETGSNSMYDALYIKPKPMAKSSPKAGAMKRPSGPVTSPKGKQVKLDRFAKKG